MPGINNKYFVSTYTASHDNLKIDANPLYNIAMAKDYRRDSLVAAVWGQQTLSEDHECERRDGAKDSLLRLSVLLVQDQIEVLFGTRFVKMSFFFEGNQSWDYFNAGGIMHYYDYDINISGPYLSDYQINLTSLGRSTTYLTLFLFLK